MGSPPQRTVGKWGEDGGEGRRRKEEKEEIVGHGGATRGGGGGVGCGGCTQWC